MGQLIAMGVIVKELSKCSVVPSKCGVPKHIWDACVNLEELHDDWIWGDVVRFLLEENEMENLDPRCDIV